MRAPVIGSAATVCPGLIRETPSPIGSTTPTRSQPGVTGTRGSLGMNALAHHQVGQGNICGQHSHSDFATLWLGALFLKQLKCIESSVVGDDDLRVPHEPLTCDDLRC